VVELETVTDVAGVPPKVTVAPVWKFWPVMVTTVPPAVVPETGEMEEMIGAWLVTNLTLALWPPQPARMATAASARVAMLTVTNFPLVRLHEFAESSSRERGSYTIL
jgi:hypothetical protein